MTDTSILVLGATGSTGRRVVHRLRAAGHSVRAASRNGEVRFDWDEPSTWVPAVAGASALYLMAPHDTPIDPPFVGCAVENGIRRIVLLSSGGIEIMGDERLMSAERTVRDSGAEWTIVRPDWFDQNFDEGFMVEAVRAGELALPLGEVKQAFVDADDIAAVAAAALTEDGHAGRSYEVTGPGALSFGEALAVIGAESGRAIRFDGSDEGYLAAQSALGVAEDDALLQVAAFAALRERGDAQLSDVVRRVTGREPKPFANYAAEAAATGVWS